MSKIVDMTGRTCGRLTILAMGDSVNGRRHWVCRCACGNVKQVSGKNLRRGITRSCGCGQDEARDRWNEEQRIRAAENPRKRERPDGYAVWLSMKDRCSNPNNKTFRHYGGRGIKVSAEWQASFETFIKDMGPRPEPDAEIDRIDNNGNYEAGNCRWVPHIVNANNKRNNRVLTFNGKSHTASEWGRIVGIRQHTILARIDRLGWSVEQALSTPTQQMAKSLRGDRRRSKTA